MRGPVHDRSDVDVIADFPETQVFKACSYVERRCVELGLVADARPELWASDELLARAAETEGHPVSSARWADVEADIASARKHFEAAVSAFRSGKPASRDDYWNVMPFQL